MLVVLFLVAIALSGHLLGTALSQRFWPELDPAEASGIGILALTSVYAWLIGVTGSWTLVLANPWLFVGYVAVVGALSYWSSVSMKFPKPELWWLIWGVLALIPLVKSLSPSDMLDWDTMAYHLAVPKMWLEAGRLEHIPFIHQSNFPQIVDHLFMVGLGFGEGFAKGFTTLLWASGGAWVFGVGRRHFGVAPARWAALIFLSCPLILWSSGSGYIDAVHGIFAAMGLLCVGEVVSSDEGLKGKLILAGFGLGGAMGSKYTGLQVAFVALLILVVVLTAKRRWRGLAMPTVGAAVLALLMACPWYIRNYANTGNPVFPFFYEQLGGRGWDQWRADLYRNEQQTFGVGRTEKGRDSSSIGAAILGLGYQPGRYINPGQTEGGGVPMGAAGAAVLLGPLAFIAFGERKGPWRSMLAASLLLLAMFFLLSQQVRYVTALVPIWALMLGSLASLKWVQVLATLQAAYTVALLYLAQAAQQLPVALGSADRTAYQQSVVSFSAFAPDINQRLGSTGKVALYDEVFGYFLNSKYIWGNPGHSQLVPYERISAPAEYILALKEIKVSHVYLNLNSLSQDNLALLFAALEGQSVPAERAATMDGDLNAKWFRLVCDALATQDLTVEAQYIRPGGKRVSALLLTVR